MSNTPHSERAFQMLLKVAETLQEFVGEYRTMRMLDENNRLTLKLEETPLQYAVRGMQYEEAGRHVIALLRQLEILPAQDPATETEERLQLAEETLRVIINDARHIINRRGHEKSFKTTVESIARRAELCLQCGTKAVLAQTLGVNRQKD